MVIDSKFGYKQTKQCYGTVCTKVWIPIKSGVADGEYTEIRRTRICDFHFEIIKNLKQQSKNALNNAPAQC